MTRQYELVRIDQQGIADEAETFQAAKHAREEERLRSLMGKGAGGRGLETIGGGAGKGQRKGKEPKGGGKQKGDDHGKGKSEGKKDDRNEWQKKK